MIKDRKARCIYRGAKLIRNIHLMNSAKYFNRKSFNAAI